MTFVAIAIVFMFGLPLSLLVESLGPKTRLRSHVVYSLGGWLFAFGGASSLLSTDPARAFPFTAASIRAAMWAVVALWTAYFWIVAIRAARRECSPSGLVFWVLVLVAGHVLVPWGSVACLPIIGFAIVMFVSLRSSTGPSANHQETTRSDSPDGSA